ncbi:hypothetical protein PR048_011945 [Dryococelus australis]|uniref:Peptidase M13 C-terminal domain-containing protein n=1 Tax=Dryococelus australis TaxID=614101 RepID=A0ABQ9HNI7_9NEOP|nr:hypothetical protein PR048_011945 [Dryococelus australis]
MTSQGEPLNLNPTPYTNERQSVWCSASTDETVDLQIEKDAHSPPRFRVIGPLSNFDEFSKAFKCPKGSYMNPKSKCETSPSGGVNDDDYEAGETVALGVLRAGRRFSFMDVECPWQLLLDIYSGEACQCARVRRGKQMRSQNRNKDMETEYRLAE